MPPKTAVLAIDTSAAHCAAALLLGDGSVATCVVEMTKGQAEQLIPIIQSLLSDNDLTFDDLSAVGVGTGPGNFTGIRIAVSAARGIALGRSIPAIGVNGFEVLSYQQPRPITALISAPRNQAYMQHFTETGEDAPTMIDTSTVVIDGPVTPEQTVDEKVMIIARIAKAKIGTDHGRPVPLYVRAADAAPPRDPAPKILT
ncbi:tRNA (adenosine(37)-N6)-threonylcarbamoyltransferase complex dimerization subunit type 1 TsaB [Marivivens niveibacter]|uniref:tRNA (Adenosine(37)-N6)-threonylcarbamoyltransferase complex dimerization subunit type 1 TsaB n=1 Tax=Marivivens niveibacter TaxID=1930667 RepID=A0A251WYH2_9RHOB|nr:tRNA (adenosine(37)-N6)-threonylcarbamoyltransferase complex dimerization subunit type 1 TsaB [Marivivens niveibacter]